MLIWLKDAPCYVDEMDPESPEADQICEFVDSVISCKKEWDGSPHERNVGACTEDTWKHLLKRQTHKHTHSCQRKRGGRVICRFNIPFLPMDRTIILVPLNEDTESEAQIEMHRNDYKKIRDFIQDNIESLSTNNFTFEEFLLKINMASVYQYHKAVRSSLKMNKIFIKRNPNAIMINNYNPKIFGMFRSNMDIQFILDPYACCAYVVDYVNKSDKGMSQALKGVFEKHKETPNSNNLEMLRSIATTYYNACEISAQEASYNILQLRMSEASTGCIFVPTAKPCNRVHMVKKTEALNEEFMRNPDSTNCFEPSIVEHYTVRPVVFENLNLAQFAAYFEYSRKKPRQRSSGRPFNGSDEEDQGDGEIDDNHDSVIPSDLSGNDHGGLPGEVYQLNGDNNGWIKRRTKSKVIRYYKFNIDSDREDYFRAILMLYKPWRDETVELMDADCEGVYRQFSTEVEEARAEFNRIDDAVLDEYNRQLSGENDEEADRENNDENEDSENNPEINRTEPGAEENDFARYTADMDDSSEGDYHTRADINEDLNNNADNTSSRKTYLEKLVLPNVLPDIDYFNLMATLNFKQRSYLTSLIGHVRYNKAEFVLRDGSNTYSPVYNFVTGGAGAGKSKLICAIYQSLLREFDFGRERDMSTPSVLLTAPTGRAAFNIQGQTLHSAFQFPISQNGDKCINQLSADVGHSMAVALKDLRFVIIDEISMVSKKHFGWIDKRLRDMFEPSIPFGGISVIVFGDFLQLPPVGGSSVFASDTTLTISSLFDFDLWSLFKVHKLIEIMRQRDDVPFAVALNNLATGSMTPVDIALFQSCVAVLDEQQLKLLEEGKIVLPPPSKIKSINLFHANRNVKATNDIILNSMDTEGAVSTAYDRVLGDCRSQTAVNQMLHSAREDASLSETRGLPKKIILKVDAQYMMTVNIDTSDGLVNGVIGVLKRIDYGRLKSNANTTVRKPIRVWILFDDERSGRALRNKQVTLRLTLGLPNLWTCVEPSTLIIRRNLKSHIKLNRTQFPIVPAEAMTVHKSQGGTYPGVVVNDCGRRTMSRSLKYVACSRATSAKGLVLICKKNKFVPPSSLARDNGASSLRNELERHDTFKFVPLFDKLTVRDESIIQILSHNVQSLRAHIDQIQRDQVYINSDIILLCETWTLPNNEVFELDNFILASRQDGQTGNPKPIGSCCFINNTFLNNRTYTSDSKYFQDRNCSVSVSLVVIDSSLFASVYCSPNASTDIILEALQFILDHPHGSVTIGGDFNVDFASYSSKKSSIVNLLSQYNLTSPLMDTVTSTTKKNTFIDNIFTSNQVIDSGKYVSFTSYHEPLWIKLLK